MIDFSSILAIPYNMSILKRYNVPGNTYFVTAVTHKRASLLIQNYDLLLESMRRAHKKGRFRLDAWVVLPDHIHLLLEPDEEDLSSLMRRIKLSFAHMLLNRRGQTSGTVWQRRFWDHLIRNDSDLNRHFDYIHYNPVKHGFVDRTASWPHSSFEMFVAKGYYERDWRVMDSRWLEGEFGE